MKSYKDIVKKEDIIKYLNNLKGKSLLVYSPTSANKIKLLEKIENENLHLMNTHLTDIDVDKINEFIKNEKDLDRVIGFGGGTANDIAKFIGNQLNIETVSIPSMLSTNVYSTNKVLMSKEGKVSTLDSKMPDLIIFDKNILNLSLQENLYGFADVLTIYTAHSDWYKSYKKGYDRMDENLYQMDVKLLEDTQKYILTNSYDDIKTNLFEMFNFIGMVGHITNLYGSGRPVSGSEHIFAKALEQRILVPHGISVGLGILIMSLYQSNYSENIEKCFEKLQIFQNAEKYHVNKEIIMKNLKELKPREGRYTVVNEMDKNDINILNEIDKILEKFKIK